MSLLEKLKNAKNQATQNFVDATLFYSRIVKDSVENTLKSSRGKILAATAVALMATSIGAQANTQEPEIVDVSHKGEVIQMIKSTSVDKNGNNVNTYGTLSDSTFFSNKGYETYYNDYPKELAKTIGDYLNKVADSRGHDVASRSEANIRMALSLEYGDTCTVKDLIGDSYGQVFKINKDIVDENGIEYRGVEVGGKKHQEIMEEYADNGGSGNVCGDELGEGEVEISFNGNDYVFEITNAVGKERIALNGEKRTMEEQTNRNYESISEQVRENKDKELQNVREIPEFEIETRNDPASQLKEVREVPKFDVETRDGFSEHKDKKEVRAYVNELAQKTRKISSPSNN